MKIKIGGYLAVSIIIAVAFVFLSMDSETSSNVIYRARLADPSLYNDGLFTESFSISHGSYEFRFVPNGDSPQILSIHITNDTQMIFSEDFELEGVEQGPESARYFTWDYLGQKQLSFSEDQEVIIKIDPHGDTMGPVTVELIIP